MKRRFDPQAALAELVRTGADDRFDIAIDYRGNWFYRGSKIERLELVKLFSTVLNRAADGSYWLITPVERGRIEVADAPFVLERVDLSQEIVFFDNVDRSHPWSQSDQLIMRERLDGRGAVPYLDIGKSIEARISSSVYYELCDLAFEREGIFGIETASGFLPLGRS